MFSTGGVGVGVGETMKIDPVTSSDAVPSLSVTISDTLLFTLNPRVKLRESDTNTPLILHSHPVTAPSVSELLSAEKSTYTGTVGVVILSIWPSVADAESVVIVKPAFGIWLGVGVGCGGPAKA